MRTAKREGMGVPLRTNVKPVTGAKPGASKVSPCQHGEKNSAGPKDLELMNTISQVADLIMKREHRESLDLINRRRLQDLDFETSKGLCISLPLDKILLQKERQ